MSVALILNALVAIPKIAGIVEGICTSIVAWYIQNRTTQTLSQISDAIALTASAQTDQDRLNAMAALQKALSNTRIISG